MLWQDYNQYCKVAAYIREEAGNINRDVNNTN